MMVNDKDFMLAVLDVFFKADIHGDLFWRTDPQYAPVTFFAMCSDFFMWACADCEEITKENLHVLLKAHEDCKAIDKEELFPELFAARVRHLQPMRLIMDKLKENNSPLYPLYLECGPP